MTTQYDLEPEGKFVRAVLPWVVAAAALILYLGGLWATVDALSSLRYGDAELLTDDEKILPILGAAERVRFAPVVKEMAVAFI
jgi:hypothetical protein